ncbi:MAG TPA: methylisocitrate lyase [Gammaproteobacteria bacterium]|jgi:methylisocitrate lyase|nr:MAG: methylisocitrate lyase [Gammaproteobacteria bacterium]HAD36205.1 methylisocitrate lyase [Gammaproteobacteria bacterium]HBK76310.1 methylisocitrate lyase [Gammaproteobacteria bacterium]HHZ71559.1 methylisocitrate lyase [Gammaproteobacteria bacterium]HIA42134.1 methylisocitrate lyase [Gammaproteobacteria bacterium]
MTWLTDNDVHKETPGDRLTQLIAQPGIVRIPGAHNALAGLLAKRAGFGCLYVSGAAVSGSMGLPDLGIMTLEELSSHVRSIYRATQLPLVVDADTGYGEAINVMRTVQELESAGAAAMQIEDQVMPKKCGHLSDKRLISTEDMCAKVAAARKARSHLRIIARTDAVDGEGLESAIERLNRYVEAGADLVFADALKDEVSIRTITQRVGAPVLANMAEFGRTPYFSAAELEVMGCRLVIWPASSLRIAARAMDRLYQDLARTGTTHQFIDDMVDRSELYDVIGYFDYESLDASVARSVVPEKKPVPSAPDGGVI